MDRNRKHGFYRSSRSKGPRIGPTHGGERSTPSQRPSVPNRSFTEELKDAVAEVFASARLPRQLELTRAQARELLDFKPSYHFNGYLNCCICYENTPLCAIGKCDHMTCLLCSLKLTYFYNNEASRGIYECPYCKQQNDFIYYCVNPFYVHLATNRKFYASKESPVLTEAELRQFVDILTHPNGCANEDSAITPTPNTVNIMQLYKIFLKNSSKVAELLTLKGLMRSVSHLSLSGDKNGLPELSERNNELISFYDQFLVVTNTNMIFESASIYYLYKLMTLPLCWFPECKQRWYQHEVTQENVNEALKRVQKFRFSTYKLMNRHVKASHSMVFCDICLNYFTNKKLVCEFVLYDLQRIGDHVKNGDTDSYPPISAHVMCQACKTYHWDLAAFKQHAKDVHFICEQCDVDHESHNVFSDYPSLFNHYKTYHYPCEEEECMFIVFSDDLQLQLHYLYKHPGINRPKCNKKPLQVTIKTSRESRDTKVNHTSSVYTFDDQATYDDFWDGSISIVYANGVPQAEQPKEPEDPLELIQDTPLSYYFKATEQEAVSPDQDKDKLQHFLSGLKGNKDLPVAPDYFNNFDPTRSSHVFSDLQTMLGYFRNPDISLFDVTTYLTDSFGRLYTFLIMSFTEQYNDVVERCTSNQSNGPSLFDLVRSYLLKFVFLFYNIHINRQKPDSKKVCINVDILKLRRQNPEMKLGPNSVLFFIAVLNFSNISNRIIVKAALNSIIEDMRTMYKDVDEPLSLTEAFNLQSGRNISSSALNPNANIDQFMPKKARNNNITKAPKKEYIVSLKGKRVPKTKEPPRPQQPAEMPTPMDEPLPPEVDNPTPISIPDGLVYLDASEVDGETLFLNHVSSANFYGLMFDTIGSMLVSNMKRFKAKTFEYSLRETTKLKIHNIAMTQKRSFTNLGELISMKKLESLQSLEPEFHRLVKECQKSDLPTIAKLWTRKCSNALRNTQVEHLEILHFYLKGNSDTSMPLCNDSEFPSLSTQTDPSDFSVPRNYAGAVGLRDQPKILSEYEFPTLTQTTKLPARNHRPRFSRSN